MEPSKSKVWDDYDENEDKMYIDSFGRDEDGDADMKVLVLTITVEGYGRSGQSGRSSKRRSSVGGEWSNSRARVQNGLLLVSELMSIEWIHYPDTSGTIGHSIFNHP